MKLSHLVLTMAILACTGLVAQNETPDIGAVPASYLGTISMRLEPSMSSKSELIPAVPLTEAPMDGRSSKNLAVPGKDPQTEDDIFKRLPHPMTGVLPGRTPSLVFELNNNVGPPSDPALAVGPDHVFMVYNTGYMVYDKDGNDLTGPLSVNNIFSSGGCCDLTVSYDAAAERWIVSYLFVGSGAEVAVSSGTDPLTSDWYVYSLPQVSDYNKLSVWSDGYYMTENTGGANKLWVMEREAMIAGDTDAGLQGFALPGIVTEGFFSPQALNVTDDNMPADGSATIVFLQDDAWGGVSEDHLKLWTLDVDWMSPGNSTISTPVEITTTPFISVFDGGSFQNLAQPGGSDIDAIQSTIMNQAQFRKFPTYNSALFSFVIDTDASEDDELAGIRWYELRQDGDGMPWSIEQEGTYTSPDGKHAWMSSLMMDQFGNIGMGYNAMAGPDTENPTDFRVSSFYTGRFANDPSGTMTVAEEVISMGTGNVSGFRFGDYSKIDIDPTEDKEFWFITEYINGGGADVVGVFQIASDFNNDIGAVTVNSPQDGQLTGAEAVTITIFNFGLEEISGFDVSYQIDGGTVVTETYSGAIASGSSAEHTFATLGDFSTQGQTYEITATTIFGADEFNGNNSTVVSVTHLFANDTGVSAITSPNSGSGLASEDITVVIENFGFALQTSIPVYYSVDGGTPVAETYTGSIAQGESDNYTFTASADLSGLGDYVIVAGTNLGSDGIPANDASSKEVSNFICQPSANCDGFGDGISELDLADQDLSVTCGDAPDGYSDETDVVFNFVLNENPFEGTFQVGYEATSMVIFIDFNDNNAFEVSEVVAQGTAADADVDYDFTLNFSDAAGVTNGLHLMRVRSVWDDGTGDLLDPCGDASFGRTVDYTANISGNLVGLEDADFVDANLSITQQDGDQFLLQFFTANYTDKLPVTVLDAQGRTLAYYTLLNSGDRYTKTIDMSYVSAGVYFVRVGDDALNLVKRIVVR